MTTTRRRTPIVGDDEQTKTRRVTVRLSEEDYQTLHDSAIRESRSVCGQIEYLIRSAGRAASAATEKGVGGA